MYDPESTARLRRELTDAGVVERFTAAEVDEALACRETTLLFVNSICGCTAKTARPGLIAALKHPSRPEKAFTVFAGADRDATARAREHFVGHPPSSPAAALYREGRLVHFFHRHDIEGIDATAFTTMLVAAFQRYFGPAVDHAIAIPDPMSEIDIDPRDLRRLLDASPPPSLIDCRDESERRLAQIRGGIAFRPELIKEITEGWPRDRVAVLYCHTGRKSLTTLKMFRKFGFARFRRLRGGIDAWAREIDSTVPVYARDDASAGKKPFF